MDTGRDTQESNDESILPKFLPASFYHLRERNVCPLDDHFASFCSWVVKSKVKEEGCKRYIREREEESDERMMCRCPDQTERPVLPMKWKRKSLSFCFVLQSLCNIFCLWFLCSILQYMSLLPHSRLDRDFILCGTIEQLERKSAYNSLFSVSWHKERKWKGKMLHSCLLLSIDHVCLAPISVDVVVSQETIERRNVCL